jgi:hypothetical protein
MTVSQIPFEGLAIGGKRVASGDGKDAPTYNPADNELMARHRDRYVVYLQQP